MVVNGMVSEIHVRMYDGMGSSLQYTGTCWIRLIVNVVTLLSICMHVLRSRTCGLPIEYGSVC